MKVDSNVLYELIVKEIGGKIDSMNYNIGNMNNLIANIQSSLSDLQCSISVNYNIMSSIYKLDIVVKINTNSSNVT